MRKTVFYMIVVKKISARLIRIQMKKIVLIENITGLIESKINGVDMD